MKTLILSILLLISLVGNAFFVKDLLTTKADTPTKSTSLEPEKLQYLAKRIFLDNPNDTIINFKPLRNQLREYAETVKQGRIGVYFEYLPTGSSIGINEKEEFPLASLLKTPVAIAAMKMIEENKIKPEDKIKLLPSDINDSYGTLWKKGAGYEITVDEAINLSLTQSDNTASVALYRVVGEENFVNIFDSLDIPQIVNNQNIVLTPKAYSSVFRSLYFSSFLKYESSNKLLDILSRSIFKDRLVAGIPESVTVSHKIGTKDNVPTEEPVYSDCGIIYVPGRQYFLCVMTQGIILTESEKHISHISKMVYDYVSHVNTEP